MNALRKIVVRVVLNALLCWVALLVVSHALTLPQSMLLAIAMALLSALCWAPVMWRSSQDRQPLEQNGQKRLLGDIAHELNAPIARIQFALGMIEETLGQEHQADVKALHDEVQDLSELVNELLSYSRLSFEAGSSAVSKVNLRSVAQRASDRENIAVELSVDPGLTAMAHEVYLTRALSNLLRNARRYAGHSGPIEVRAGLYGEQIELIVADHGPGLPESELEQIFEPFYRLDPSRTTATGGKGLGLAIVKSCVDACRGEVFCRNRKPSGLEVVIRLRSTSG